MEMPGPNQNVIMNIQADKNVVAQGQPSARIIEISITPPQNVITKERTPLSLSLVLDRSGSMEGEKLEYVKQAAAHVLDLLEPKDRISVVVYDDHVNTIIPLQEVTDSFRVEAKSRIREVHTGGMTFLSGGWLQGCEEIAANNSESFINRTLLLTDGLPNVGITNLEELTTHAREIFRRGISTTCFGVGRDFNEHLLEAMSTAGGGNFHYLETMNAIPLEFEREFEELVNVLMRDAELSIVLPEGVTAKVSAGYDAKTEGNLYTIALGSFYSGKEKRVYLTLHFEKGGSADPVEIKSTIRGKDVDDHICEDVKMLSLNVVSTEEEVEVAQDQPLIERFVVVDMADRANEALKHERVGDRAGASRILNRSLHEYDDNLSPLIKSKYAFMANQMNTGLDETARKRYHQEEYLNKRAREFIRDYRLDMVNGHLIARIEKYAVLMDTGIPMSIGDFDQWYFLNQVHDLSESYMGVSTEYISRMVGTKVDIVLGSNILRTLNVLIQAHQQRITFGFERPTFQSEKIPLSDFMGVPIANVMIGNTRCEAFIDTGARLSYVAKSFVASYSPCGVEKDFYPGMGEFETQVYEVPFQIGSKQIMLRCGVLPGLLEKALFITGKLGIIGTEIFEKFEVHLALPENGMYLE